MDTKYEQTLFDGQVRFIYLLKSKFGILSRLVLLLLELDIFIFGYYVFH